MPMLRVRCAACGAMIPTGLDLDYEAFKDLTYADRTIECRVCERVQTWNVNDVDVSVFKKPATRDAIAPSSRSASLNTSTSCPASFAKQARPGLAFW